MGVYIAELYSGVKMCYIEDQCRGKTERNERKTVMKELIKSMTEALVLCGMVAVVCIILL